MDTQTHTSTDGKFAVDFDLNHPLVAYAASIFTPEELRQVLSADAGEQMVLDYARDHNVTLDEALREVNAGGTWAKIRAL